MPIDSKAGKKQVSVSKMQIKMGNYGNFLESHWLAPPGTSCHTEFSVENK